MISESRLSYQNCARTQNVFIWKVPLLVDSGILKRSDKQEALPS